MKERDSIIGVVKKITFPCLKIVNHQRVLSGYCILDTETDEVMLAKYELHDIDHKLQALHSIFQF